MASQGSFGPAVSSGSALKIQPQNQPQPACAPLVDTAYRLPGSGKSTRQRNPHRLLLKFGRMILSHSRSPFAHNTRLKERHNSATGPRRKNVGRTPVSNQRKVEIVKNLDALVSDGWPKEAAKQKLLEEKGLSIRTIEAYQNEVNEDKEMIEAAKREVFSANK